MEALISKKYATDLFLNKSVIHRGPDSMVSPRSLFRIRNFFVGFACQMIKRLILYQFYFESEFMCSTTTSVPSLGAQPPFVNCKERSSESGLYPQRFVPPPTCWAFSA